MMGWKGKSREWLKKKAGEVSGRTWKIFLRHLKKFKLYFMRTNLENLKSKVGETLYLSWIPPFLLLQLLVFS